MKVISQEVVKVIDARQGAKGEAACRAAAPRNGVAIVVPDKVEGRTKQY